MQQGRCVRLFFEARTSICSGALCVRLVIGDACGDLPDSCLSNCFTHFQGIFSTHSVVSSLNSGLKFEPFFFVILSANMGFVS